MRFRKLALITLVALSLLAVGILPINGAGSAFADETAVNPAEPETRDVIILRSGQIVEGTILEETGDLVKIIVVVGKMKAPTTYRLSEILEIQRDLVVVTDLEGAKKRGDDADGGGGWGVRDDENPVNSATDKPKVYRFPIDGHIVGGFPGLLNYLQQSNRRDIISLTPVERTMRDALSYDPDVIIVEIDADAPSSVGWDGGAVTVPLQPIFQEVIDSESVRLVFWVKEASFGAAFLPFICPEMYFESEAFFGGIGTLDDFDIGDELVNEKQISLRIGRAEGVAIKNGYDPAIIRGMARQQNWLCYRFRHGKIEFLEHKPRPIDGDDWVILTDDGKGDQKDEMKTRGNDVLNIDAQTAMEIGLSKGTYDDIDDLVFALGIRGEYDLIEGRAERNFDEWRDRVENGIDRMAQLQRDLNEAGKGSGRNESESKKIGRQTRVLKEIRAMYGTFEEVFDPTHAERAQIDIQLEALKEAVLEARNKEKEASRNRSRRR